MVNTWQTVPIGFGAEEAWRKIVENRLGKVGKIICDAFGDCTVRVGEGEPTAAFEVSADAPSLVVTYIEENGAVSVEQIGDSTALRQCPVTNGSLRGVLREKDGKLAADFGFGNRENAEKHLRQGDILCFDAPCVTLCDGGTVTAFAGKRACVEAMLRTAEAMTEGNALFIFTVQNTARFRGAAPGAYSVPDGCPIVWLESGAGKGINVLVADKSAVYDNTVTRRLTEAAKKAGIAANQTVDKDNQSGAVYAMTAGKGHPVGVLRLPCVSCGTPTETVRESDIDAAAKVLEAFIKG